MPRVPRRSNSERTRYTSNAAARMERISTIGYVRSVSWKRSFELNSPRPKYRIYRHSDLQCGSILRRVGGRGEGGSGARQVCADRLRRPHSWSRHGMIVGSRLPVPSRVEITSYQPTSRYQSGQLPRSPFVDTFIDSDTLLRCTS